MGCNAPLWITTFDLTEDGFERTDLRLSVLSSGSSGNSTYMETDSGGLLVDAGLSRRRIESHLASIGRNLGDVRAILLTHGHSDHTCGVSSLLRDRPIAVFAAPGVGDSLGAS